jgi:enoyl-CoA hydratase
VELDTGRPNALTLEAVQSLRDALAFDADAPVVVLSGRPDAFCAGLDNATLSAGAAEREELLASMGELLLEVLESPTRIVATCEGHAVAAGAMLLLVSDLRLGTPGSYRVGFTEQSLGMPLPDLPALLARERLDRRRLHELAVLGRTVGPEEAVAAGFLDAVEPPETIRQRAAERATELAALSEAAYRGSVASVWGDALERIRESVERQLHRRDRAAAGRA